MASNKNVKTFIITVLPNEMLTTVFFNLDVEDKCSSAQVCRRWRDVIYAEMLWRDQTIQLYLGNNLSAVLPSLNSRGVNVLQLTTGSPDHTPKPHTPYMVGNLRQILRVVQSLENLDLLRVNMHHLTGVFVGDFPNLKVLKLPRRSLTRNSIYGLANHCKNLEVLHIALNDVCNLCMGYFAQNLRKLRVLNVNNNMMITDDGVRALTVAKPPLEILNLAYCGYISDISATEIGSSLALIQSLDLTLSAITNTGISKLASLEHLTELILKLCDGINDDCVKILAEAGSKISTLDLSYCKDIGDGSLGNLGQFPLPLKAFNVSCTSVSDLGIRSFVQEQLKLEVFSVICCSEITDETLAIIAAECPALRMLNFKHCIHTSREGRDALRSSRPDLQLDWTENNDYVKFKK